MLVNTITFNVKGVTFKNENNKDIQKEIKRVLKEYKDNDYFGELYGGYTNKEIMEMDLNVSEYEGYTFPAKLVGDEHNGEECLKIYIKTYNDEYVHIGYAPKKEIEDIATWLTKENIKVDGELCVVGGKYKHLEIYEEDYEEKERVAIHELTYGIQVNLKFYNNEINKKENVEKVEETYNFAQKISRSHKDDAKQKIWVTLIIMFVFICSIISVAFKAIETEITSAQEIDNVVENIIKTGEN